ncbi:hypothetical protein ACFSCX_16290, partial [Bacillus salitolerans]
SPDGIAGSKIREKLQATKEYNKLADIVQSEESTWDKVSDALVKMGKMGFDFIIGDDIKTLLDEDASTLDRVIAGLGLTPGGKLVNTGLKLAKMGNKVVLDLQFFSKGKINLSSRDELLDSVSNQKLKNAIDQMYRPDAKIGNGSLADAVRHELKTGELVGGKSHIQKANERIKNLENIIKKQDLNDNDLELAFELLNDLKNALNGK